MTRCVAQLGHDGKYVCSRRCIECCDIFAERARVMRQGTNPSVVSLVCNLERRETGLRAMVGNKGGRDRERVQRAPGRRQVEPRPPSRCMCGGSGMCRFKLQRARQRAGKADIEAVHGENQYRDSKVMRSQAQYCAESGVAFCRYPRVRRVPNSAFTSCPRRAWKTSRRYALHGALNQH